MSLKKCANANRALIAGRGGWRITQGGSAGRAYSPSILLQVRPVARVAAGLLASVQGHLQKLSADDTDVVQTTNINRSSPEHSHASARIANGTDRATRRSSPEFPHSKHSPMRLSSVQSSSCAGALSVVGTLGETGPVTLRRGALHCKVIGVTAADVGSEAWKRAPGARVRGVDHFSPWSFVWWVWHRYGLSRST